MQRVLAILLLLTLRPLVAGAQGSGRLTLTVSLNADTVGNTFNPVIRTTELVKDPQVAPMLASGFPVRLHYRLETYRSRSGWMDAFIRQTEWDAVIHHEPLLDQYQVVEVFRNSQRTYRYAGQDQLATGLAIPREVRFGPRDAGNYYYVVTLEVSTLSDNDLKELERFLQGDAGATVSGGEPVGTAFANAIKHLLISVTALPSIRREQRSSEFTVR